MTSTSPTPGARSAVFSSVWEIFVQGEELASLIQLQLEVRGFAVFGDSHLPGCVLERSLNLVSNLSLVVNPILRECLSGAGHP